MNDISYETAFKKLLDETRHTTHGLWNKEDFKEWGKRALKLIEELFGVSSTYYTTFLRVHHEALLLGTGDRRFGTHVSLCVSILKSAYRESGNNSGD
jgi:hypothetical protein